MARIRRKRRKLLRGGSNEPEFAPKQGGTRVDTHLEHVEGPSNREAVTQQQAGAQQDAEMQMAMNQTGGNQETGSAGSDEVAVPQSNATDADGNRAMAGSAAMLMQSRQNAPAKQEPANPSIGGSRRRRKRKTRKGKKKSKKKGTKKKRRKKRRRTKKKYKFARKYHQKGCSRRSCKKH